MNRSRASRGTALALSLVPGWGHIYLGEELKGLTIFTLAAISAFAWINASWMYLASFRPVLLTLGILGFIGLWVWSTVEVFVKTRPERVGRLRRRCDHLLWEGTLHFLSRDDHAAEEDFVECARIDCLDVEAHFRSGVAAARRGERELARRRLERARRLDVDMKWSWEIRRELDRLNGARATPGRAEAEAAAEPDAEEKQSEGVR